jgi:hypothetical protein
MKDTEQLQHREYVRLAGMGFNCDAARRAFKNGIAKDQFIELQRDTGLTISEEMGAWRPLHSTDKIKEPRNIVNFGDVPMVPARKYGPGPDFRLPKSAEDGIIESTDNQEVEPIELFAGVEATAAV